MKKPVRRWSLSSSCLDFLNSFTGRAMHLLPFSILWNQVVNFIDFGQNHFDTFYCFFSEEVSHISPFWLIKFLRYKKKRKKTTKTFTFSTSLVFHHEEVLLNDQYHKKRWIIETSFSTRAFSVAELQVNSLSGHCWYCNRNEKIAF